MQQDLGRAIRSYRKAKGWSTEDLAKASEVDKGTVNRVELGGNATVDTLLKLARALELDLDITLKSQGEAAQPARDVQLSPGLSALVTPSTESMEAPGEERAVVPLRSMLLATLPLFPTHLVLYGLIGSLTEEQARKIWRPVLDLVERLDPDTAAGANDKKRKS